MGCAIPFAIAAIAKNHTGNRANRYPFCRPITDRVQTLSQIRLKTTKRFSDHAGRPSSAGNRSGNRVTNSSMKWRHCAASPIKKRRAVRSRPARSLSTGLRTIVRRSATTAAAESPAVPVSTLRRFSFMTVSALFPFFLRQARLHYPFQQSGRQRLVQREMDGPFGGGDVFEFVLERFDHGQTSGEQTAMVRKRGVPHQRSFVLEGRNPIADSLGGVRWQSRPNRRAHLVQRAAGGFR